MNSRAPLLVAADPGRRKLAGDQLFIDLDLSTTNLPPGSCLAVGSAVIEVTAKPHLGCRTFAARFGTEALRFVNSPEGRELRAPKAHRVQISLRLPAENASRTSPGASARAASSGSAGVTRGTCTMTS
jgi:hypothetical protein